MPRMKLNMKEAVKFEPVPADSYPVEIENVEEKEAKTGTAMAALRLNITEGEHEGKKLFTNMMLEGPGAGFTIDLIEKALNVDLSEEEEFEFPTEDLIGTRLTAVVTQYEYPEGSGTMRNNVERFLSA